MMMMMTEEFGEKQAQASGPDLVDKVPGFARVHIISNLTTIIVIIIINITNITIIINIMIVFLRLHFSRPDQVNIETVSMSEKGNLYH